jgi:hypothetical protein
MAFALIPEKPFPHEIKLEHKCFHLIATSRMIPLVLPPAIKRLKTFTIMLDGCNQQRNCAENQTYSFGHVERVIS